MCKYVPFIRQLVIENKAYVVITQHGTYVCAHGDRVHTTITPIKYIIRDGIIANSSDFLLWIPYHHGLLSPWGHGHPTLNVKIIEKTT